MKTILISKSSCGVVSVDTENLTIDVLPCQREAIRSIYKIDEDCTVKCGDVIEEAHAGDLLFTFYEGDFDRRYVIVTCKDWFDMLTKYEEKRQKEKEEWAAKHAEDNLNTVSCDSESCN